jgi:hypothetical protein
MNLTLCPVLSSQCFSALPVNPWISMYPTHCQTHRKFRSTCACAGFGVEGAIFALPYLTGNCANIVSRHHLMMKS